ncbi:DNA repair protein rad50 [Sorochytrium milnesiophthora]
MSSIDRLLIRGIRSFDPQGTNVIQFYSPLTIIVGHNGSGKTTVIECLKYSTTGELPPGAKTGGAFIHDPKATPALAFYVAHETEVKAQVRLKFRNVNGKVMVCTRSLQLTQKAKKVEQKTLESILETKDPVTGERVSLSSRCSDLDAEMPIHLGVSQAVLENVIFCHQEESNWPLADPKTLKVKFDAIFASSRYTKALENIRSVKKTLEVELREDNAWLAHRKEKKDKADSIRNQEAATRDRVQRHQTNITQLNERLTGIAERISHLMKHVANGENLENTLIFRGEQRNNVMQFMSDLKANMVEFTEETDEQLLQSLEEHKRRLNEASGSQDNMKTEEQQLEAQNKDNADRVKAKNDQRAILGHQIREYNTSIEQRQALVKEFVRKLGIKAVNVDRLNQQDIQLFAQKLQSLVLTLNTQFEDVKREAAERETSIAAALQTKQSDIVSAGLLKANAMQKLEGNRRKREEHTNGINRSGTNEEDILSLQTVLKQSEQRLAQLRDSYQKATEGNQAQALKAEMETIDASINAMSREMLTTNQDATTRATLTSRKNDKHLKEVLLNRLLKECEADLNATLQRVPATAEMDSAVSSALRQKQDLLAARERQHAEISRKVNEADTKMQLAKSELEKDAQSLKDNESRLRTYCQDRSYDDLVQEEETTIDACKMDIKGFESLSDVYARFLAQTERTHKCALCTRGFESAEALQSLVTRINQVINMSPARKIESETKLREATTRLNELKTYAAPLHNEITRIRALAPEREQRIAEAEVARSSAAERADQLSHEIATIKAETATLTSLQVKVAEIGRVNGDCERLAREIKQLENELSVTSTNKSITDIQQALEELQDGRTLNRQKLERHTAMVQGLQSDIDACQAKLYSITQDLSTKQAVAVERERLQRFVIEIDHENSKLEQELRSADQQLRLLREEEAQIKREQTAIKSSNDEQKQRAETALADAQRAQQSFDTVHRTVNKFESQNIQSQLHALETETATLENKIQHNNERIEEIRNHLNSLKLNLSDMHNLVRNVNDNLSYRRKRQELANVDQAIAKLQEELRTYEGHSYTRQLGDLKKEQDELVRESSKLQGELSQLQVNLRQMQDDLAGEYKNAESDYREMVIKVKTAELAAADLEKYAKALDAALMKYHTIKMDEINKIIRELWVNTYQGSDIDTIEIRADKESTRGARQFNYRVVMVKGDSELDMRGRCSAGQKVLTSLIIRLALAETFCLNCGILALDEPTTNLDRQNIESLAESLSSIIKMRRQQTNFQLIVITHDEEFMQLLGRSEFADYYWRVFKDDNQHSVIERQAIAEY